MARVSTRPCAAAPSPLPRRRAARDGPARRDLPAAAARPGLMVLATDDYSSVPRPCAGGLRTAGARFAVSTGSGTGGWCRTGRARPCSPSSGLHGDHDPAARHGVEPPHRDSLLLARACRPRTRFSPLRGRQALRRRPPGSVGCSHVIDTLTTPLTWPGFGGVTVLALLALCVASLLAGAVDAIVGGGGLVQLSALLIVLPGGRRSSPSRRTSWRASSARRRRR